MAGTRTVHRGSRGRFAGASSGKAETVKVGRGYQRSPSLGGGGSKVNHPKGLTNRSKPARIRYAAANTARTAARNVNTKKALSTIGKTTLAAGVGLGVSYGASRAINRAVLGPKPFKAKGHTEVVTGPNGKTRKIKGVYSGVGVGRREVVSMPHTALRTDANVGGRSARSGAFIAGAAKSAATAAKPRVSPNYSAVKGTKEYVGRRLKPGEGRGFKLSAG